MAEEPQPETAAATTEVVVTEAATAPPPPGPEPEPEKKAVEPEEPEKKVDEAEVSAVATEESAAAIAESSSFKEESNLVSDLADPEKKALDELKQLVAAAIAADEFSLPPPPPPPQPAAAPPVAEPKADEPKPDESKAEEAKQAESEEAKQPESEEAKQPEAEEAKQPEPEEAKPAEPEEAKPAEPSETAPEAEPVEKTVVVAEDDGAKNVEAIEETVVPVDAPAPAAAAPESEAAPAAEPEAAPAPAPKTVEIWGVPLLGDERSDTVLLKFLRAREFKVKDAMAMLKADVLWRKRFGIDALLDADLEVPEMAKAAFYCGVDREGHPVCYNVYGEFQDKELYEKAFGDEERREKFLKWRIQLLEKGIRSRLDFAPGGVCSMVQVTDLKNSPPMLGKHRPVTRQALALLQDNYPEFIAKKVFINVPWWYLAVNRMMSPFLTQRTKSKFVFASPAKSAEALFKYIAPEQVPVQLGGLFMEDDPDFSTSDAVSELTIKPASKESIEIPATQNSTLVWELRVLGWEVSYGAEFVPDAEGGYTVIVQKTRKVAAIDEPVIKGSFKVGEPGKIVLTINNPTSKKKKLLYRSKAKSSVESM